MDLAPYIDHTILKPTTTVHDVRTLCTEAMEFQFAAVCVPPPFVKNASGLLQNSTVKVATVVGFPFGYSVAAAKIAEVERAIADGATEIDVVINLSALKSGSWNYLSAEMKALTEKIHHHGCIIKVIIESGVLTRDEILKCCEIYSELRVDFMKTSTGYAEVGATLGAVQLMRASLPSSIRIKASGGIRSYDLAKQFVDAGADRIGTSSGVAIVKQQI